MIEFKPGKEYNFSKCSDRGTRLLTKFYGEIEEYTDLFINMGITHFDDRSAISGTIIGMRGDETAIRIYMWFAPETVYYSLKDQEADRWLTDTVTNYLKDIMKDSLLMKYIVDGEETAIEEF